MRAIWPDGGNAGSHPRRLRRSISSFARAKDRQAPLLRQKTRRRPPRLAFLRKQSQTHPRIARRRTCPMRFFPAPTRERPALKADFIAICRVWRSSANKAKRIPRVARRRTCPHALLSRSPCKQPRLKRFYRHPFAMAASAQGRNTAPILSQPVLSPPSRPGRRSPQKIRDRIYPPLPRLRWSQGPDRPSPESRRS